jgi:hypothetical protein
MVSPQSQVGPFYALDEELLPAQGIRQARQEGMTSAQLPAVADPSRQEALIVRREQGGLAAGVPEQHPG